MIREAIKLLSQNKIRPQIYSTYRSSPPYGTLTQDELRTSTFEALSLNGLQNDINEGTARILDDTGKYVIFTRQKTAAYTPIEIMFNCWPHDGYDIAHSVDEVPFKERLSLFKWVNKGIEAVQKVAKNHQRPLEKINIEQHIAKEEAEGKHFFSLSYPHAHIHVYGIPVQPLGAEEGFNESILKSEDRGIYIDPTIFIAFDFIKKHYPNIDFKLNLGTSAIELDMNFSTSITSQEIKLITDVMQYWKKTWKEVASCFTDFSLDENNRYVLLLKDQRQKLVEKLINDNDFLSNESQGVLKWLVAHLKPSDFSNYVRKLSTLYKGVAGSWNINIDLLEKKKKLILAPRIIATSQKAGSSGGFLVNMDKSQYLPNEIKNCLTELYKEVLAEL